MPVDPRRGAPCDDAAVEVEPVSEDLVEPMARVLVEGHRDHAPLGAKHVLADLDVAIRSVRASLDTCAGYAVTHTRAVLGYMLVPFPDMPGPTNIRLQMAHHAVEADVARAVYRRLYEAVSADLVAGGITYHSLPVLADKPEHIQAFFELEFGIDQI